MNRRLLRTLPVVRAAAIRTFSAKHSLRNKEPARYNTQSERVDHEHHKAPISFEYVMSVIKTMDFDSQKERVIEQYIKSGGKLAPSELKILMKSLTFDSSRERVFRLLAGAEKEETSSPAVESYTREMEGTFNRWFVDLMRKAIYNLIVNVLGSQDPKTNHQIQSRIDKILPPGNQK